MTCGLVLPSCWPLFYFDCNNREIACKLSPIMDVHVTEKSTGTSNGPETTQENGALIAQVLGPGGGGDKTSVLVLCFCL